MKRAFPCPCCGYRMFEQAPGSFAICEICCWEDDIVQLAFPDCAGGANQCSLIEGQTNYARYGACERRVASEFCLAAPDGCRDSLWQPLDVTRDRYLRWGNLSDHGLWQTVKNPGDLCLYYWRPDYWLRDGKWIAG